ncbi:hypothetical protein [Ohtaekwangia sp.]|uniref:hypothetical protein n=1 Tax=Ohtaekwangia sp. TaxID=2066019 RepID=UPI002F957BDE
MEKRFSLFHLSASIFHIYRLFFLKQVPVLSLARLPGCTVVENAVPVRRRLML